MSFFACTDPAEGGRVMNRYRPSRGNSETGPATQATAATTKRSGRLSHVDTHLPELLDEGRTVMFKPTAENQRQGVG